MLHDTSRRDMAIDQFQNVRDAISRTLREKGRPIKAKEVQGHTPTSVGYAMEKFRRTFTRCYGSYCGGGSKGPDWITWHPDIERFEVAMYGFEPFGHLSGKKMEVCHV